MQPMMQQQQQSLMNPQDYRLKVRQQPKYARVAVGKEKGTDRKPIDPPPIVQLTVSQTKDAARSYLQNPYLILTARLVNGKEDDSSPEERPASDPKDNDLVGTVVSSLYSLKDTDNSQGGFFVFGDLSVRKEGTYKLEFALYELKLTSKECWLLARTTSDKFTVYPHKLFPGMAESTFLTRSFSDQGVRLRLRKDSRSMTTRKRNSSVANSADDGRYKQPYGHHNHSPELSPNGHGHDQYRRSNSLNDPNLASTHLDRSRGPMQQTTGYYSDAPPPVRTDYGTGQYGYTSYDDRPAKRHRVDTTEGIYDDYNPYGPRTVPEINNIYPVSSAGYAMSAQGPVTSLPAPNHYMPMPRLNTQMPPQHTAPNSAASSFSPNAQRSPGGAYYQPQAAIYGSPYQNSTPPLAQSGLGIGLPNPDLEAVTKQENGLQ